MAPGIRPDFLSECMGFLLCWFFRRADKSQRSAIAAQPDCGGEECSGEYQSNPKTRAAKISSRSKCYRVDGVGAESERLRSEADQTVLQHGGEMRSVERDLLEEANRKQRKDRPEKCRPSRPA